MSDTLAVRALVMRGGTSKGVFFTATELDAASGGDAAARDALLMRVLGSPDPYGKQIDGLGGATSSTSKVVVVGPTTRAGCDVEYRFGQVAIDAPLIDWSGNCGNLSAAVAPFAIARGLAAAPRDGTARVRLWQADIARMLVAHVPMRGGEVVEDGDFALDGVAFPGAEIVLEFLDPAGGAGGLFPSGRVADTLDVPGLGTVAATLIDAGNPAVFVDAAALGLRGTELPAALNADEALLARCEALRAAAAVAMGLARTAEEATRLRPATPKLVLVAPAADYLASSGRPVAAADCDLLLRALSMGRFHHALPGTMAVALAAAAAVPGTRVHALRGTATGRLRGGHPSGLIAARAEAAVDERGAWQVTKVVLSRTARRLMDGQVFVPRCRG